MPRCQCGEVCTEGQNRIHDPANTAAILQQQPEVITALRLASLLRPAACFTRIIFGFVLSLSLIGGSMRGTVETFGPSGSTKLETLIVSTFALSGGSLKDETTSACKNPVGNCTHFRFSPSRATQHDHKRMLNSSRKLHTLSVLPFSRDAA